MSKYKMLKWAKDLFPIYRSITGKGTRKTLSYFEKINPEFKRLKYKTGQKIFDWVVPEEWNIKNSYIEHESGKKYAQFSKSNLHVVNYSTSINKWIFKDELLRHIHTRKDLPDAIPYITSYYKKKLGLLFI